MKTKASTNLCFALIALLSRSAFAQATYENWQQSVFTYAELSDPAICARMADPDGDGLLNLIEFAFNTDPKIPEAAPPYQTYLDAQDRLCIEYPQWKSILGTVVFPQTTSALGATWQSGLGKFTLLNTAPLDAERDWLTIRDVADATSAPKRFFRFMADTDFDYDGIPDKWELMNGLCPVLIGDGASDIDGDGRSNYQEFLDGTDPLTHDIPIPAIEVPAAPSNVTVTVLGDGSKLVQWADNSENETFFNIVNVDTNGVQTILGRVGPNQTWFIIPAQSQP